MLDSLMKQYIIPVTCILTMLLQDLQMDVDIRQFNFPLGDLMGML